jgi:NADPH-dependent 2,4-dienoyl-CoA reductase/sulfur reductase-like enzyme
MTYLIAGASLAGAKAALILRVEGFEGRIVLVGEESERPYERPSLSNREEADDGREGQGAGASGL